MFKVTLSHDGHTFYLRGTTWAFVEDRGNVFDSIEAAKAGIERAKKFLVKRLHRNIEIIAA